LCGHGATFSLSPEPCLVVSVINTPAITLLSPLSLHDALPIFLGDGGEITQLVHLHCPPSLTQPAPSCYRSITAAQPLRSNHSFCAARCHRYSPSHHGRPGGARAGTQGGGRAHAAHRRPGPARAARVLE